MFVKLLKYDFKSMFRVFVPLWLALLAISAVNRFTLSMDAFAGFNIPGVVLFIAYIGIIIAVMVVTFVLIVQRFYNGLLKEEGYLMFTLPVRTWQLIGSKCVAAMVVYVLSSVAAIVSVFVVMQVPFNLPDFWRGLREALPELLKGDSLLMIVLLILTVLSGTLVSVGHIYAAMAIGHLSGKHRVACSVAAYILINMALSFLAGTAVNAARRLHIDIEWTLDTISGVNIMLLAVILIELLQFAVFFVVSERILSKRLNLE